MTNLIDGIKKVYQCTICHHTYDDIDSAIKCYNSDKPVYVKVGDIVVSHFSFGWFDGDEKWVINANRFSVKKETKDKFGNTLKIPSHSIKRTKCPNGDSNCFDWCCTLGFYYVVSDIRRYNDDEHVFVIHLRTGAMLGEQGHDVHRIYDSSYLFIVNDIVDKSIIDDSKRLIGI